MSRTADSDARIQELDAANADVARAQRRLLDAIAAIDGSGVWEAEGARDLAHWLSMRFGISTWKAQRWIAAARRLPQLPAIADAFARGTLSLDKTVELTRFAEPSDERGALAWAREVSVAGVRRRADREMRIDADEVTADEHARRLEWWWLEEGRRLGLHAELPAAQGAVVVKALERAAARLPSMPGEGGPWNVETRRAEALAAICSSAIASDADPDRATVVLHARVDEAGLLADAEIEGATAVPRSVAERLLCDARIEVAFEDVSGEVVGLRSARREPPSPDGAAAPVPRPGVPVPGLRHRRVHPRASRPVVEPRRVDGPRQPRAGLLVPSPARARARVGSDAHAQGRDPLDHRRRRAVPSRTAIAGPDLTRRAAG